jgi:putative transcriptional regulator
VIEIRLSELLAKHGKTQYWIVKTTGLTPQTVSKLFKKQTTGIEFSTLDAICKAFDCEASEVLVYVREEEKKEIEPKNKTKKASSRR